MVSCDEFSHEYRAWAPPEQVEHKGVWRCEKCGTVLDSQAISTERVPVEQPKPIDWDCYC